MIILKKVTTMKDIAKEAGVSLTTVSYVLNNSAKQKISHEMRLKIHQLAHDMNYVPNLAAKSLASRRSGIIGIIIIENKNSFLSRAYSYYAIIDELRNQASLIGYDVMVVSIADFEKDIKNISKRSFDGVIIIDSPMDHIYEITKRCYVPIVFVDSIVNDPIFATVISDYNSAVAQAKVLLESDELFLVIDDFNNTNFNEIIFSNFAASNIFIKTNENSLEEFFESKKSMCGIVVGEILGLMAEKIFDNDKFVVFTNSSKKTLISDKTKKVVLSNKSKVQQALNILKKKIDLVYDANSEIIFLAKPEE